jgi:soluble lytic murein transglycosylase-like protein
MYLSQHRGLGDASSVASQIQAAAPSYGVPPALALAVATKESNLNQAARGSAGEIGVFQLMPGTAAQLGVNPSDLTANIDGGLAYLSQLYAQFGDWGTALEAYNGGPGNVTRGTVSSAAQSYSASVLAAAGMDSASSVTVAPGADSSDSGDSGDDSSDSGSNTALWIGVAAVGLLAIWAVAS